MIRRLPLVFVPQPDGGFAVTSPILPELVTEGDTLEKTFSNVSDALAAVLELYAEECRPLPPGIELPIAGEVISTDVLVIVPEPTKDPILSLGANPVTSDVDDASVNHDKYIYEP